MKKVALCLICLFALSVDQKATQAHHVSAMAIILFFMIGSR